MQIHELKSPPGSRKRRKIVGRGPGSGHGKTSCKGHKGQNCRSGRGILLSLEGGQVPLIRRIPKMGFRAKNHKFFQVVNLSSLTRFKEGTIVNIDFLKSHGLVNNLKQPVKILGDGDLKKPLVVQAHSFSKSAEDKITKAGGKAEALKTTAEAPEAKAKETKTEAKPKQKA